MLDFSKSDTAQADDPENAPGSNPVSYIYVIGLLGRPEGPVKIGYSQDPEVRRCELQTGIPDVLVLHHQEPVDQRIVGDLERLLHKGIADHRRRKEWFNMTPAEAISQIKFAVIHHEQKLLERLEFAY